MGAVEHFKTLCCLGLPPESAMVAVTPLLHEIIPHGWTRVALLEPDGTIRSPYTENPEAVALFRERLWKFMDDPLSPMSMWKSSFRAAGIGWTLHMQGRDWFENAYYREVEAPLDSCWMLGAMVGDGERSVAYVNLTRPRSARPYSADDVQRLDRLRPWLGHALRPARSGGGQLEDKDAMRGPGAPVLSGQMVLSPDASLVFQTPGLEHLLAILTGELANYTCHVPVRERLPAPILKLVRQIVGAASSALGSPPRMEVSTAYGVLTLEAKWLLPADAIPEDVAKDPKGCIIAVTIDLREHAIAHAARVLRESGATPAQLKVGLQLALGKSRLAIADELGLKATTVADLTKKLYQSLDVHNFAELGAKIWLGQKQDGARHIFPRA